VNINFSFLLCVFTASFLLNVQSLKAQGYVSPFKYDNGNVVRKSANEIRYEESRRNSNNYNYTNKVPERSTVKEKETLDQSKAEREYIHKMWEIKRKEDSIENAEKRANAMANSYKYSRYLLETEHYKLAKHIQNLMNQMDYEAVDSLTELYLTNLPSEQYHSADWDNYRERLGNRLFSQLCLGHLDSAWFSFKRIELADQTALAKKLYYDHTKPRDLPSIKTFLLYQSGAYDTALQVCRSFLKSLPAKDSFSVSFPEMYCLQSRCLLALGNTKEAKRSLDEYLLKTKTDKNVSLVMNYNGFPIPYICETIGLIYQEMGKTDSALFYFRAAVKTYTELTGLEGYARNYVLPFFIGKFKAPVREAFLQGALLGGYKLDDNKNEGTILLTIASKLGIPKAAYIIENKIAWVPPVKKANKLTPKKKNKN
jgi:tetratricopeptide (TPR) repeat protein